MAEISPVLQFILSRPQFKGPGTVPGFDLNAPFDQERRNDRLGAPATPGQDPKEQLLADQYPSWLALYLGGGDLNRGIAIMDHAKG